MGGRGSNSGLGEAGSGGNKIKYFKAPVRFQPITQTERKTEKKTKSKKTSEITYKQTKSADGSRTYTATVKGTPVSIEYSANSPANPYTVTVGDGNPRLFKDLNSAKNYVKKQLNK